ncbi:dTDP-glucose 4,6-dehydratase [Vagococcus silagei]|uniref:dTDP-glucose 4,6-dehydratase n=1 Tax=Vagococcus silagei TaxID=2508885 RepID=A0A4S3B428_9ENTE|nr:dTDP-glucose 4,6-dehydratase [Vagococcus silagei]THB60156.1 dTDP-glucose 4,6-dehydratase [Vagococcus silagei]
MKAFLVTGGAGFIGSNFIRYMMDKYSSYEIINLDLLTYAGNLKNVEEVADLSRYHFVQGSINDRELVTNLVKQYKVDAIINFAAESHVDRSIEAAYPFVETNVNGTLSLLEVAKKCQINRFVQISTDEVYGSLGLEGYFFEHSPLNPSSPYSASKASADLLVQSYHKTYGLDTIITRCSNNYGPYQHSEKLLPSIILKAFQNEKLPIYGEGQNVRDWLHVFDHCSAIDLALHSGKSGEIYNIGAYHERTNNEMVDFIIGALDREESLKEFIPDRLGHDFRYAIDSSKIRRELKWQPKMDFDKSLIETIDWYITEQQ